MGIPRGPGPQPGGETRFGFGSTWNAGSPERRRGRPESGMGRRVASGSRALRRQAAKGDRNAPIGPQPTVPPCAQAVQVRDRRWRFCHGDQTHGVVSRETATALAPVPGSCARSTRLQFHLQVHSQARYRSSSGLSGDILLGQFDSSTKGQFRDAPSGSSTELRADHFDGSLVPRGTRLFGEIWIGTRADRERGQSREPRRPVLPRRDEQFAARWARSGTTPPWLDEFIDQWGPPEGGTASSLPGRLSSSEGAGAPSQERPFCVAPSHLPPAATTLRRLATPSDEFVADCVLLGRVRAEETGSPRSNYSASGSPLGSSHGLDRRLLDHQSMNSRFEKPKP